MLDVTDLSDSFGDSRAEEKKLGFWLALPSFVLIVLPLFYFVVQSVSTGQDQFGPLRDFLNQYHVALFVVMIPCLGALMASVYLIIVKDITNAFDNGHSSRY